MNEKINQRIKLFLNDEITSSKVIELFYDIGKLLNDDKFNYYRISALDNFLRKEYGLIICFSKKNLIKILKFYQLCSNISKEKLPKIDWNSYLFIINKKNYTELIDICINHNMNKRELEYYIKTNKFLKITMNYNDPATDELLKLQENINKK